MPAGRPRKELDAEQVYKLARIGCTYDEIADIFGVSKSTISRNYRTECARAQGEFRTSLRRAQYLRATRDKSDTMLVHLGKSYLGQNDKSPAQEMKVVVERLDRSARHPGATPPDPAEGEG